MSAMQRPSSFENAPEVFWEPSGGSSSDRSMWGDVAAVTSAADARETDADCGSVGDEAPAASQAALLFGIATGSSWISEAQQDSAGADADARVECRVSSTAFEDELASADDSPTGYIGEDASVLDDATSSLRVAPGCSGGADGVAQVSGQALVRVSLRVRPIDGNKIIGVPRKNVISITKEAATGGNQWLSSQRGSEHEHEFDCVFGPESNQAEVYEWSARPLVTAAVTEGRNATIIVYGATGAGKTHTMFGTGSDVGLVHRALDEVFSIVSGIDNIVAKVAFLELYNDKVECLLQEGGGTCEIREDARNQFMQINGLMEVPVFSREEALYQLQVGMQQRKVEATAANARSSRSHAIFELKLERIDSGQLHSKISLIDLAGSERASQTKNVGKALQDGAKINTSLLALAECIKALADERKRDARIPFYNSKLTRLLKYSFKGDGLVSMIANIHPGREHYEDSHNTVIYAKHAAGITIEPVVRKAPSRVSLSSAQLQQPPQQPPQQPQQTPSHRQSAGGGGGTTPTNTNMPGRGSRTTTPVRRNHYPAASSAVGISGAADGPSRSRGMCSSQAPPMGRERSGSLALPMASKTGIASRMTPRLSTGGGLHAAAVGRDSGYGSYCLGGGASIGESSAIGAAVAVIAGQRGDIPVELGAEPAFGSTFGASIWRSVSPSSSPRSPPSSNAPQDNSLWMSIIETLQAEKAALDRRLLEFAVDRERERGQLQVEIGRLKAANREKDQQILALMGSL